MCKPQNANRVIYMISHTSAQIFPFKTGIAQYKDERQNS